MSVKIEVSIVLICYNKGSELRMVMAALEAQDFPLERVEIVMVDDGSTDGTVETFSRPWGRLNIKFIGLEHCGERARLRNKGAEESSGKTLIFLDSDMVPAPHFVSEHMRVMRNRANHVSLGTRTCLIEYDKEILTQQTVSESFSLIESFPAMNDERTTIFEFWKRNNRSPSNLWTLLFSHNFAVGKEEFLRVGGFDPEFSRNWGAEDVELGYRLHASHCSFSVNHAAHCYHLFHPSATKNKIIQLRLNYDIFYKKHPSWEVELFCEEYKFWSLEYNLLRESILAGRHLVEGKAIQLPQEASRSAGRVVAFGIHPECFPGGAVGTFLIPGGLSGTVGCIDGIGIKKRFEAARFDDAFISFRYKEIHEGLFEILMEEALRISKRVWIVDELGFTKNASAHGRPPTRRKILFTVRNIMGRVLPFQEHFYQSLAFHLEDLGVGVGFQRAYDPFGEIPVHGSFCGFSDPDKKRRIEQMYGRKWSILDDRIPSIMDGEVGRASQRAIGNRIWWDEVGILHDEKRISDSVLPHFDRILVRRSADIAVLQSNAPMSYLPVGVHSSELERIVRSKRKPGPFRFLWISNFTDIPSGARELLLAFKAAFPNDDDVSLHMVHSGNTVPSVRNHGLNSTFQGFLDEFARMYSEKLDFYRRQFLPTGSDRRITVQSGDLSVEEINNLLADSDCLVDTSGTSNLSPFTLNAAAMGKKPLLCNTAAYSGYLDDRLRIGIRSKARSGAVLEPMPERIWPGERSNFRYVEFLEPDTADLASALRNVRGNPDVLEVSREAQAWFREEFDWKRLAARLIDAVL